MGDTLNFGPEWLRQLSGGNSVSAPPPSPAPGFGKYKLADYRYGREEMLALFTPPDGIPEELKQFTPIVTEKAQEPLAFQQLSDEEQRIMSQSINSTAVLRMMGRGAPPIRGRGVSIERGRGRGRGRGEGFVQRGVSYDESGDGGFGRARPRIEGSWEDGGQKYQRSFPTRFDETTPPNKVYQRSLSSDNWRERDEEDEDGDWRKAGASKWNNTRGSWRDRREGGFDYDRSHSMNGPKDFSRQYQRSRSSESWDEEDLPEWSMDGGSEEVGTFDASGQFVATKYRPQKGRRHDDEGGNPPLLEEHEHEKSPPNDQQKIKHEESMTRKLESSSKKDINENQTKSSSDVKSVQKTPSPRLPQKGNSNSAENRDTSDANPSQTKTSKSSSSLETGKPPSKVTNSPKRSSPPGQVKLTPKESSRSEGKQNESDSAIKKSDKDSQKAKSVNSVTSKVPTSKENTGSSESKKREKLKSEAEALEQLQETVETVVAGIAVMDDEDEETKNVATKMAPSALPKDHENYSKWFYRDPQGDLQGPFLSSEMADWFSAGYFTMNLMVRRGCDEKFSPLGDLIKRWGRVPFLQGPNPAPLMNSAHSSPDISKQQQQQQQQQRDQQEHIQALQQQYLLQQQFAQQQLLMRQFQIQQIGQIMSQLQENEGFKSLPPLQQQQVVMQTMLKQTSTNPLVNPSSLPLKLSPRSSDDSPLTIPKIPTTSTQQQQSFHRSLSTPNTSQGQNPLPASIWDIEPCVNAADLEAQMKEKQLEEERKYQESLELQKEIIRKEQEELQRQKDEIEKQRKEMERKREMERKKQEELKKLEEDHRRKMEEDKKRLEEDHRRLMEEKRKAEEEERERLKREDEIRRQEMKREMQKQEELQKQQQEAQRLKEEEQERQKQIEIQRRQEIQRQEENLRKQQQEALRKLQQEQLANIQLPSHAQWASTQPVINTSGGKSLLEIQQQEEQERLQREEMLREQAEFQRQQQLIQQQQQQQKSWTTAVGKQTSSTKSLLEIQEEQARQLERERKKREENQQQAAKNINLSSASVWSGSVPSVTNWANEGAWGAMRSSGQLNVNSNNGNSNNNALGFWDDAIITSGPVKKQSSKPAKAGGEFPALAGPNPSKPNKSAQNKVAKPSKQKKEEEAVQRLFQTAVNPEDDFTQWCEKQLRSMETSVDIPTFIAFLQEVESPYEVHDYVRSYLGESRMAVDFGKAFLEKRSQYKNRSKPVEEDSIWGPAPAITPRELRQPNPAMWEEAVKGKANKKKKNKMMKVDASILGFTVHADPNRMVGEIDNDAAATSTR